VNELKDRPSLRTYLPRCLGSSSDRLSPSTRGSGDRTDCYGSSTVVGGWRIMCIEREVAGLKFNEILGSMILELRTCEEPDLISVAVATCEDSCPSSFDMFYKRG
jgi:hypothetical protein